ncbi:MAG: acyl-CoA dehydrogenase [Acidimicrobiales bacterium]|nr:acyl-CoA dehydrogenase [Acidimicrobiales bacterium]
MQLALTPDERAVQDVFVAFFTNESPPEIVRAAEPLGFDAELWAKLAATGAPSMALPESVGGGGADLAALAVVVEEAGRTLAPVPLIEHAIALRLAHAADLDATTLAAIASSNRIAAIALRPAVGGTAGLVPAGAVADVILVLDGTDLVLAEVPAPAHAPANTAAAPLADRPLGGAKVLATGAKAARLIARARAEWFALTATEAAAMGRQVLQLGVDYVMERTQFGVPVGSFQAVQHGLADASVRIEGATLLAQRAVWALDADRPEANELAAMAHLFCCDAAQQAAAASMQFHGGYGYAEEYDVQLYYRRVKGRMLLPGSPGSQYQALADDLLGPVSGGAS